MPVLTPSKDFAFLPCSYRLLFPFLIFCRMQPSWGLVSFCGNVTESRAYRQENLPTPVRLIVLTISALLIIPRHEVGNVVAHSAILPSELGSPTPVDRNHVPRLQAWAPRF